jgi:hypothetical protein
MVSAESFHSKDAARVEKEGGSANALLASMYDVIALPQLIAWTTSGTCYGLRMKAAVARVTVL